VYDSCNLLELFADGKDKAEGLFFFGGKLINPKEVFVFHVGEG